MTTADKLADSINAERVVRFSYPHMAAHGRKIQLLRTFSPFRIDGASVIGWDHGRDEVRRYSIDKIGDIVEYVAAEEYVQPNA